MATETGTATSNPWSRLSSAEQFVVAGGVLALVAAVLPWITASFMGQSASSSGIDLATGEEPILLFNGIVTAVLGLVAVALVGALEWDLTTQAASVVLGLAVALDAGIYLFAPEVAFGGGRGGALAAAIVDPSIGVFVAIFGGILVVVGGVLGLR